MAEEALFDLEQWVDPQHSALLVVDPQNDFCAPDGLVAKRGFDLSRIQAAAPRLGKFISEVRKFGIPVIWVQVMDKPDKMLRSRKAVQNIREVKTTDENTYGRMWYPVVGSPLPGESIVTKYHYDAFEDTDLNLILKTKGIKTVLVTGFTTTVCVETACRHGYIKGYYIVLVSDCTDERSQAEYDSTVHNIRTYFGKVATSDELSAIWKTKYECLPLVSGE
jgi:nicotinamidase-related amidase